MKENILFIIPARANSTRFPKKNFFKIKGKTLLQHKIENCRKSGIGKILVTSDDPEILKYAKKFNVDLIRERPNSLKGDGPTTPIVYDAVKYYEKETKIKLDIIVLSQLTTPFIFASDFIEAINYFIKHDIFKSLISCSILDNNFSWLVFEDNKEKSYFLPALLTKKLNNFIKNKKTYIPNGGIYILRRSALKKSGKIYSPPFKIWEMSRKNSIDIDYIEDGILAKEIAKGFF